MTVLAFLVGLLGMAAHWGARYAGERTESGFLQYFFQTERGRSLGTFCGYLGLFGGIVAAGPIEGAQVWAAVFMAGYMADSTINKG